MEGQTHEQGDAEQLAVATQRAGKNARDAKAMSKIKDDDIVRQEAADMLSATSANSTTARDHPVSYNPDDLLDQHEAARVLGVKPITLKRWRQQRTGVPYEEYPKGRRTVVRYRYSDLTAWIERHRKRVEPGE